MDKHPGLNFSKDCIPVGATKSTGILEVTTILIDGQDITVNPSRISSFYPGSMNYLTNSREPAYFPR